MKRNIRKHPGRGFCGQYTHRLGLGLCPHSLVARPLGW